MKTTTPVTAAMRLEEKARTAFQQMQARKEDKPRKLNLRTCTDRLRAMRTELTEKCADTSQEYIEALGWMIHYITHPDDRTIVNELLFYTGIICALMGLCLGICGSVYVFLHNLPEAQTLQPYAAGFALAAFLCFWGVRRK